MFDLKEYYVFQIEGLDAKIVLSSLQEFFSRNTEFKPFFYQISFYRCEDNKIILILKNDAPFQLILHLVNALQFNKYQQSSKSKVLAWCQIRNENSMLKSYMHRRKLLIYNSKRDISNQTVAGITETRISFKYKLNNTDFVEYPDSSNIEYFDPELDIFALKAFTNEEILPYFSDLPTNNDTKDTPTHNIILNILYILIVSILFILIFPSSHSIIWQQYSLMISYLAFVILLLSNEKTISSKPLLFLFYSSFFLMVLLQIFNLASFSLEPILYSILPIMALIIKKYLLKILKAEFQIHLAKYIILLLISLVVIAYNIHLFL